MNDLNIHSGERSEPFRHKKTQLRTTLSCADNIAIINIKKYCLDNNYLSKKKKQ